MKRLLAVAGLFAVLQPAAVLAQDQEPTHPTAAINAYEDCLRNAVRQIGDRGSDDHAIAMRAMPMCANEWVTVKDRTLEKLPYLEQGIMDRQMDSTQVDGAMNIVQSEREREGLRRLPFMPGVSPD
jgi:hypothetical protein